MLSDVTHRRHRAGGWLIGCLVIVGAALVAAPVGPSWTSFDQVSTFAGAPSAEWDEPVSGQEGYDALLASSADVSTGDRILGDGAELEIGLDALEQIEYPWVQMLPGWTIEFTGSNEDLFGLTHTRERRIEIFVRPDQTPEMLAHVIAHEIGHAIDVTLNDGDDRRAWQEARGIEHAEWWPGSGATDFATGAGDFAESFASWQASHQGFRSELGGLPTDEQLTLLTELSIDR